MQIVTRNRMPDHTHDCEALSLRSYQRCVKSLWPLVLAAAMLLSACGGSSSSGSSKQSANLAGNW